MKEDEEDEEEEEEEEEEEWGEESDKKGDGLPFLSSVSTFSLASTEEAAAVAFVDDAVVPEAAASSENSIAVADDEEEALVRVQDKTGEQWDIIVVPVEGFATMLLLLLVVELVLSPLFPRVD